MSCKVFENIMRVDKFYSTASFQW